MKINNKNRVNPVGKSSSVRNNKPADTPNSPTEMANIHKDTNANSVFGTHASVKLSLPALRQNLAKKLQSLGGEIPKSLADKSPNSHPQNKKISLQAKAAQAAYGRALKDSETIDRRASVISWPDGMENHEDPQRPYKEALFLLDVLDRGNVEHVTINKNEPFDAAIRRTIKEHRFDELLPSDMKPTDPKI